LSQHIKEAKARQASTNLKKLVVVLEKLEMERFLEVSSQDYFDNCKMEHGISKIFRLSLNNNHRK